MDAHPGTFAKLYRQRFPTKERAAKEVVWQVLCARFFSRYVAETDSVVDVGAGYCEFINNIRAARRVAVDANPELASCAAAGVETHCGPAEDLSFLGTETVDVVFSSNFFEHLPNKATLNAVVAEMHRILKPNGKLLVMGPNVKCVPGAYWDYYDHHIPLTELSVAELLQLNGFRIEESIARFMPYTVKGRLPTTAWLVTCFLALRKLSFPLFGKQFFVVGRK
jgi:SAM-dependent methyltransferase